MALPENDTDSQRAFTAAMEVVARQIGSEISYIVSTGPHFTAVPPHLREAASSYLQHPGKCLRPALLLFCCGAAGGNWAVAMPAATAVEVYHTWTLLHDDIIDHDAFRRGHPTAHVLGAELARRSWSLPAVAAADYGVSLAILAGDLLHGLAMSLMATVEAPPELLLALLQRMSGWLTPQLLAGEQLDVQLSHQRWETIAEEDIMTMMRQKTGALLGYCAQAGVLLAQRHPAKEEKMALVMNACAARCGLAFQIQDDLLGLSGDEKSFGKPIGSDIREGKRTLVMWRTLASCTKSERQRLLGILGNAEATAMDLDDVRAIVVRSGSDAYARDCSERNLNDALAVMEKTLAPSRERDILRGLVLSMVRRQR